MENLVSESGTLSISVVDFEEHRPVKDVFVNCLGGLGVNKGFVEAAVRGLVVDKRGLEELKAEGKNLDTMSVRDKSDVYVVCVPLGLFMGLLGYREKGSGEGEEMGEIEENK